MKRVAKIKEALDEKKAVDIVEYDFSNKDYFVDYVIIATTLADKHAEALLDNLKKILKPLGENFLGIDKSDDWTVIDLGDILIHLMSEEYRAKYQIDSLMKDYLKKI